MKFFYDGKQVDYYEKAGKNSGNYSCDFDAVSAGRAISKTRIPGHIISPGMNRAIMKGIAIMPVK